MAPVNLSSTYVPGSGALLQWDVVPGSVGIQIKATLPSGSNVTQRIAGFERTQFLVPNALLSPGTYTWRVQAACSTVPPGYGATPISAPDNFTVPSGPFVCGDPITDVDGNAYPTVQIGSQCWMASNLLTTRYANGDVIPTGLSNGAWTATTEGAYSIYLDDPTLVSSYGLLYNWYAAVDLRGLCPTGWHVPDDLEWTTLVNGQGGMANAGGALKATGTLGAGTGLWAAPNTGATNSSGFSAIPGGLRNFLGAYLIKDERGFWWTTTPYTSTMAYRWRMDYDLTAADRDRPNKTNGFSVRCLKN